jgi:hypothetical protein
VTNMRLALTRMKANACQGEDHAGYKR